SDPRLSLDDQANRIETVRGIDCYLWKTLIHPCNTRRSWLRPAESILYGWYSQGRNEVPRQWSREATVVLLERRVGTVIFDRIQALNPSARVLYRAAD